MVDALTPEQKVALEKATQEAQKLIEEKKKQEEQAKINELVEQEKKKQEELAAKIKEAEDRAKKLEEDAARQKREADEKLIAMQKKIEELTTSRAPIQYQDPFKQSSSTSAKDIVKGLTDEQIKEIEYRSAEAFFGKDIYASMSRK